MNTQGGKMLENEIGFDWLSFTIKLELEDIEALKQENVEKLCKNLMFDFNIIPKFCGGHNGYKNRISYDNSISVNFNDVSKNDYDDVKLYQFISMGIHVVITGNGCRMLEKKFKESDMSWVDYLNFLKVSNVKFKRVDIAYDDYHKLLDFDVMTEKVIKGEVLSISKKKRSVESIDFSKLEELGSNGESYGKTLYFGRRGSTLMLRFYDKKQERLKKGDLSVQELDSWQRYEMELRDEKCQQFLNQYIISQDIAKLYKDFLFSSLKFIDITQKNKSRCPISEFWQKFIDGGEKIKLASKSVDINLESVIRWIDESVYGHLSVLAKIADESGINFASLFKKDERELGFRQQNLLNEFENLEEIDKKKIAKKIFKIGSKKS